MILIPRWHATVFADSVTENSDKSQGVHPSNIQPQNLSKSNDASAVKETPLNIVLPPDSVVHSTDMKLVPQTNSSIASEVPITMTSTSTTTAQPSTSTAEPTPTPSGGSVPPPELHKWIIRDNTTNITCIIAQMAMQLNVTYPGTNSQILNATLNVAGNNSEVAGSCMGAQSMKINWGPGHSLQINFGVNQTAKDFYVSGFVLQVNASILKDYNGTDGVIKYTNTKQEFTAPLEMSYKCDKAQKVNLTAADKLPAVLTMQNTQFEAYMNSTKPEFGAAQDCDTMDTPDIVPIAVGCALAILVLVVLVAYLIGRKRSQNRGYLSM
ncbi:hypothetical protein RUM43_008521 [Polyplax serrata]|uniref:Lysosome-associated membrane glycoprotein 5 n=1 Tax=Polyplax serrata TaxID=468196 RepID=A0AAN8PV36_POLSC